MAASYRVTAPYVTLKTVDPATGGATVRGFYANAVVPGELIDPDNLAHHLELEMVEKVDDTPAEPEAKPAKTAPKSAG